MIDKLRQVNIWLHAFLLPCIAAGLPFLQWSIGNHIPKVTSIALIALAANFVLFPGLPGRLKRIKERPIFWMLILPFIVDLIGMLHTENMKDGWRIITLHLSVLSLPLTILGSDTSPKIIRNTLWALVISTIAATLLSFRNGFGFMNDLTAFRLDAERVILMHRVYFGMYIDFCIIMLAAKFASDSRLVIRLLCAFIIGVLLWFIWLIAAKMAALALVLVAMGTTLLWLAGKGRKKALRGIIALAVIIPFGVYLYAPQLIVKARIIASGGILVRENTAYNPLTSLDVRNMIWRLYIYTLNKNDAWLFGVGTGDVLDTMNKTYKLAGKYWQESYFNAHNQYLEDIMRNGIPGLAALLAMFMVPLILAWQKRSLLAFALILLLITCLFTECLMNRVTGVVFCVLLNTLMIYPLIDKNQFGLQAEKTV
ncbi:MAG: O-antigen ligase family protein [Bacteroidota bacterium]